MTAGGDAWFPFGPARPAPLTLFCLHHAGGGAAAYAGWRGPLAPGIDVAPVLLPGREQRIDEPPYQDMPALVAALAEALAPRLDRPYALFGHSFGAALAFELAARLPRAPVHLFVSAWCPPAGPAPAGPPAPLDDADLLAELARHGGIPAALAGDAEMMAALLRPLRADLHLLRAHRPAGAAPARGALTILGGRDDPLVPPERLLRWAAALRAAPPVIFPGGHFYLRACLPALLDALRDRLARHACAPARCG